MDTAGQLNVEYWFRLLYECLTGGCYVSGGLVGIEAWAAYLWGFITAVGYLLAILGLGMIVYATVRLFELREREKEQYGPIVIAESKRDENPRWLHIQSLMDSSNPNDWRQAIIEADIMLEDMLTRQGYKGEGVADKLKLVERSDFATLQDAWEAHGVRNQIAHTGVAFDLSETLARRTMARFEAVFREFDLL